MNLIILLLFFNTTHDSIDTFKLDTKGRALIGVRSQACSIYEDQSIVICTKSTLFHFDNNGSLIRRIGQQGQGPNEFVSISTAVWTGKNYIIADGRTLKTSIIDANGKFLRYKKKYFNKIISSKGKLFYVYGGVIKQLIKEKPPFIGEFVISDGKMIVNNNRFHILSDVCVGLFYNYNDHFVSIGEEKIFVMDEVGPVIYGYESQGRKKLGEIRLKLPHFIHAPKEMPKGFNGHNGSIAIRTKIENWNDSWSRILGFDWFEGRMYIAYTTPTGIPDEPIENIVCSYQPKTKKVTAISINANDFLGFQKGRAFSLESNDEWEDSDPEYTVRVLQWD